MLIETIESKSHATTVQTVGRTVTHFATTLRRSSQKVSIELSSEFAHTELIDPTVAAVDLLGDFKRLAAALSPRDPSTQDDLVQEMCLGVLECSQPGAKSFFKSLAAWRAKDYLRWWLTPMKRKEALAPKPSATADDDPVQAA